MSGSMKGSVRELSRHTPKALVTNRRGDDPRPTAQPGLLSSLHHTLGNRAVQHLFASGAIQAKLTVGRPDDSYEQEADRVADAVMRMPEPQVQRQCAECEEEERLQTKPIENRITPLLQRQTGPEEEEPIQAKTGGNAPVISSNLESGINALHGGGQPLSKEARAFFEPRFGRDFSEVRIHTDSRANQLARSINARAFTRGNDIVFGDGEYHSKSLGGKRLLGHELTHVVQQQSPGIMVQRLRGVGHDLSSPRFANDPVLEEVYDGNRIIEKGDRGPYVAKIQHALHDAGFLFTRFGIDGIFGNETKSKVMQFQRRSRNRLAVDGDVGPETLTELDRRFPSTPLPSGGTGPYSMTCMKEVLCAWNEPLINDLRNLRVILVDRLYWADETYNGSSWVSTPMEGAGETSGNTIHIATNDNCQNVASSLYHEYQHARSPRSYYHRSWAEEEQRVYTIQTNWEIARGYPNSSLTTTDPITGETVVDPSAVDANVNTYPGIATNSSEEIIEKVGTDRVRVRDNGRIRVRDARAGDSVPGSRQISNPRLVLRRTWHC